MAKWTSKEMSVKIASTQEAIIFLETIQKQIKTVDIVANYYPGKATIRLEGAKENIKDAIEEVKDLHIIIADMLYPSSNGEYIYDIEHLTKMTGKTFPIKTLMKILELLGLQAIREDEKIVASINYKEMEKIISKIDMIMGNMPYEVATTSLRNVLTTIAVAKQISVEDAITWAKKANIIKEDDLQRLILTMESDQAIEKCLKTKR